MEIINHILIIFKFAIVRVILFKVLIEALLFHLVLKAVVDKFRGDNLLYYLFDSVFDSNIL